MCVVAGDSDSRTSRDGALHAAALAGEWLSRLLPLGAPFDRIRIGSPADAPAAGAMLFSPNDETCKKRAKEPNKTENRTSLTRGFPEERGLSQNEP